MYGPGFKKMRTVLLSSANQVDFEIFEYVDPKAERCMDNFEYWKSGFFHIFIILKGCVQISEIGRKQRSKIWEIVRDKGYKMALSMKIHSATLFKLSHMKIWQDDKPC